MHGWHSATALGSHCAPPPTHTHNTALLAQPSRVLCNLLSPVFQSAQRMLSVGQLQKRGLAAAAGALGGDSAVKAVGAKRADARRCAALASLEKSS